MSYVSMSFTLFSVDVFRGEGKGQDVKDTTERPSVKKESRASEGPPRDSGTLMGWEGMAGASISQRNAPTNQSLPFFLDWLVAIFFPSNVPGSGAQDGRASLAHFFLLHQAMAKGQDRISAIAWRRRRKKCAVAKRPGRSSSFFFH